jgi:hypothetical protein
MCKLSKLYRQNFLHSKMVTTLFKDFATRIGNKLIVFEAVVSWDIFVANLTNDPMKK